MSATLECPFCGQTLEPPDTEGRVEIVCPVCNKMFVVGGRTTLTPKSPAGPSGEGWYLAVANGTRYGPVGQDVIVNWVQEGRIGAEDLIWRQGMRTWMPCLSTPPFSEHTKRMT